MHRLFCTFLTLSILGGLGSILACATPKSAKAPKRQVKAASPTSAPAQETDPFGGPKHWDNLIDHFEFDCPVTDLVLDKKHRVTLGEHDFIIEGRDMRLAKSNWGRQLRIGVLAGIEDPSKRTTANLRYAARQFIRKKVDFVLINGDIGGSRDDIHEVFKVLVAYFPFPILFHSGNTEPTSALNRIYGMMAKDVPRLINLNWVRHIDLGHIHLLSLPGHHERATLYAGGCHYQKKDLEAISLLAQQIAAEGQLAILSAHNVPKSQGQAGLDYSFDMGNIGDSQLTDLIAESPIPFGIFSHVVEAGGRATHDLYEGTPLNKRDQKGARQLYVNVGAATSTPILLHSGSSSRGMAAVFSIENWTASVEFIKLRPLWKHSKKRYKKKKPKRKKKKKKKSTGSWKGL